MKNYILGLFLSLSQGRYLSEVNYISLDQLSAAEEEGNSKTALTLLKNLTKVEMVSDINDAGKKSIGFDDVIKATKALVEKKTPKKGQEMWDNIIAQVAN
jgi:hypothetical protein